MASTARASAVIALGKVSSSSEEVVAMIRPLLKDPDRRVRLAEDTIGRIGRRRRADEQDDRERDCDKELHDIGLHGDGVPETAGASWYAVKVSGPHRPRSPSSAHDRQAASTRTETGRRLLSTPATPMDIAATSQNTKSANVNRPSSVD